jgi:methylated-DNA-[protein]-cysteine S-methyltransferase
MQAQLAVFDGDLGWFGLLGAARSIQRLYIGHASADEVRERVASDHIDGWTEKNWWPELRRRLIDYSAGVRDDFRDIEIGDSTRTPFERCVVRTLRRVGYGETVSYGELARRAGAPGAARAVGSVMRRNCVPLIVPCHRVIAAGGKLGGFSAPQGLDLKRRLLELESTAVDRLRFRPPRGR